MGVIVSIQERLARLQAQSMQSRATTSLIEEIGITKTIEQSDKLGSDWIVYKLGDVVLRREYVEQENPTGTSENPIEWSENTQLIPNAFYIYNAVRKVWTGAAGSSASWDDDGFVEF